MAGAQEARDDDHDADNVIGWDFSPLWIFS